MLFLLLNFLLHGSEIVAIMRTRTWNPHVFSRLYRHRTDQRPRGCWHDVACAPTVVWTLGRVGSRTRFMCIDDQTRPLRRVFCVLDGSKSWLYDIS